MMKTILKILVIVILAFTNSYAQLTHTLTQTARNTQYGEAYGVAVGPDGTVFLAGEDGLRVYSYDGTSFANTELNSLSVCIYLT